MLVRWGQIWDAAKKSPKNDFNMVSGDELGLPSDMLYMHLGRA